MPRRTPRLAALALLLPACAPDGAPPPEAPAHAEAAEAGADHAGELARALARLGPALEREVWPRFRPDTFPLMLVLPDEGVLLAGWPDDPPEGFAPLETSPGVLWRPGTEGSEASTVVSVGGRPVSQVVAGPGGPRLPREVELAVHEGYHLEQWSRAVEGRRFGTSENTFLVTRYPVLDANLETAWAREGTHLARALRADSDARAAREAARFVEARRARHRAIGGDLAAFDHQAELNEGLAEYAGLLGRLLHETELDGRAARERLAALLADRLDDPSDRIQAPLRARFYASGAAQALLLDRLAGRGWKDELESGDLTLTDALAAAAEGAGGTAAEPAGGREGAAPAEAPSEELEELRARVASEIETVRRHREARVDATFGMAGWTLVLSPMELRQRFQLCGFDPQNLVQVSEEQLLHTRWFRPCLGDLLDADLQAPVLQDGPTGELKVAIEGHDVELRSAGRRFDPPGHREELRVRDLEITAEGVTVRSRGAIVFREGAVLHVSPLPPEFRPPALDF